MGQSFRPRVAFYPFVLALGLLSLLRCSVPSVVHSQTKPGTPSAPPVTVSVVEVSPKTASLYTEYTGTHGLPGHGGDSCPGGRVYHAEALPRWTNRQAGGRLYLLDQRLFLAEVQKAKAAVAKAEADLRYAKEGVEVFRAESRLAQSRAALIKTEQGRGALRPWSRTRRPRNKTWTGLLPYATCRGKKWRPARRS